MMTNKEIEEELKKHKEMDNLYLRYIEEPFNIPNVLIHLERLKLKNCNIKEIPNNFNKIEVLNLNNCEIEK